MSNPRFANAVRESAFSLTLSAAMIEHLLSDAKHPLDCHGNTWWALARRGLVTIVGEGKHCRAELTAEGEIVAKLLRLAGYEAKEVRRAA